MSDYGLLITVFFIGVTGAFFSGMLGLGGAIILVPMMLYIPPLLGVGILSMKQVAGITIVRSRIYKKNTGSGIKKSSCCYDSTGSRSYVDRCFNHVR